MRKLLILLVLVAAPLQAQRSLEWDRVAVKARLDAEGTLHVREEQAYVFNGDWNGGERIFRVGKGQQFTFERISRVTDSGMVELAQGSLDDVDHYQFAGENTLRWRSRLPSDPAFSDTRITYVLEYRLANILQRRGGRYDLDNDFAFPDRSGTIRRFTLDLELDSLWRSDDLPRHIARTDLSPGRSVVVHGLLRYTGTGAPQTQRSTLYFRLALAAIGLLVPFLMWRRFVRHEREIGRLAPLDTASVNRLSIERELLCIPAEVVGTAWDEEASANEVSALLARWTGEGKLISTAHGSEEMSLRLGVPREIFEGYERELIDKLFFAGDETSTTAIRAHYKQSGFNPASLVSRHLQDKANALAEMKEAAQGSSKLLSLGLFLLAVVLIAAGVRRGATPATPVVGVFLFFLWVVAIFIAMQWRGRIDYGLSKTKGVVISIALAVIGAVVMIVGDFTAWPAHFGFTAAALLVANNVMNVARSKKGPGAIRFRKRLATMRQYFIEELQKSTPAIDDRWFPYLIAFGLDKEASTWGEAFGGPSTSRIVTGSTLHSSSSSSSSSSWTGGGGAFGGAGATGSWGTAAAGLASGVASASSSSGGGGGRSGGGGGGGW